MKINISDDCPHIKVSVMKTDFGYRLWIYHFEQRYRYETSLLLELGHGSQFDTLVLNVTDTDNDEFAGKITVTDSPLNITDYWTFETRDKETEHYVFIEKKQMWPLHPDGSKFYKPADLVVENDWS